MMRVLVVIVGSLALMVVCTLLNGWALSILWGWFFVPALGLPELSFLQAAGIMMAVTFLTYQHIATQPEKENSENSTAKLFGQCAGVVLRPLFAVLFGWILHFFM